MSNEEIIKAIDTKIGGLSVNAVVEMLKMVVGNFEQGTDLVVERILSSLESRMEESAFVALCESI